MSLQISNKRQFDRVISVSLLPPRRRELAVEKKYPGNYKRSHLVRPIVRPNAVEKFIRKKGCISHKTGIPPAKRSELSLY